MGDFMRPKILEISSGFCTSALCGQLLATDFGEVLRLEPADGDPLRKTSPRTPDGLGHLFHLLNRQKKTEYLPQDAHLASQRFQQLAMEADILLIEQVPDILQASVIDIDALLVRWPSKVLCVIDPIGLQHDNGWNELFVEALGGLLVCNGYPDSPPVVSGVPYALHAAALYAYTGILAAHWVRHRSERGQIVRLSAVDCVVSLLGNFLPSYLLTGELPQRIGNRHTIAAPWNSYPTTDGGVVICTGSGESWWKKITSAIERPELLSDHRYDSGEKRVQNVDEVDSIVSQWTQKRSSKEVVMLMDAFGVPASEIEPVENVITSPHFTKIRGLVEWRSIEGAAMDKIPLCGPPVKLSDYTLDRVTQSRSAKLVVTKHDDPHLVAPEQIRPKAALAGIKVLEFASRTSTPFAGRLLRDLGAEVVKIEPLKGDALRAAGQLVGDSSYLFHINNAGKQSIAIDLSKDEGRTLVKELVKETDVWMENLAPGTAESMGLGYAELSAINQALVYASCSGFGHASNFGKKRALDTVVQAATGVMYMTGYAEQQPVKIGISAMDLAAAVAMSGSILFALTQRQTSGHGTYIDLAMADIGVWMTQVAWPEVFYGPGHPGRDGNRSKCASPNGVFVTTDGAVAISIITDSQWRALIALIADAKFSDDFGNLTLADRATRSEHIETRIQTWASGQDTVSVLANCNENGIPAVPVRNLEDIVRDPSMRDKGLLIDVVHPTAGNMKVLGNPIRMSLTPPEVLSSAPILGEHSATVIRSWLKLSAAEIERFIDSGVVAGA
jgi:crotonobetainyl-CoA:carnitine CoA-transferase CaiB-like acyl-CoA transferase